MSRKNIIPPFKPCFVLDKEFLVLDISPLILETLSAQEMIFVLSQT